MIEENSGGSCDYYVKFVEFPMADNKQPYLAECGDLIEALEMTPNEANIFKEIWRTAAARQGKKKKGHTEVRAAEKLVWCSNRILAIAKRNEFLSKL